MEAYVAMFALTLARVGTFVHAAPLLGGSQVPRSVKVGLTFALTVLLFNFDSPEPTLGGLTLTQGPLGWLSFAAAMAREAVLGGLFGFALSLFLVPARVAGEMIAQESGLTFANVVTAAGDGSSNPFSVVLELVASLVFFSLDLHHVFLLALQETFQTYPLGQAYALPNWDLVNAAGKAQEGGLLLAAPVVFCLFLTTVVLALMARAAPQLNLYTVGFPLRILICLGGTMLLLPTLVSGFIRLFAFFLELLQLRG